MTWKCNRCGCDDWRGESNSKVEVTRHPPSGVTVRKRICRHCGQNRFETHEIVVPDGCAIVLQQQEHTHDGDADA